MPAGTPQDAPPLDHAPAPITPRSCHLRARLSQHRTTKASHFTLVRSVQSHMCPGLRPAARGRLMSPSTPGYAGRTQRSPARPFHCASEPSLLLSPAVALHISEEPFSGHSDVHQRRARYVLPRRCALHGPLQPHRRPPSSSPQGQLTSGCLHLSTSPLLLPAEVKSLRALRSLCSPPAGGTTNPGRLPRHFGVWAAPDSHKALYLRSPFTAPADYNYRFRDTPTGSSLGY
ncbi:hypothetical protein NDU88_001127 [Pleurodeles waltl]|uniref:Uncharacterized protein n=1 Tax=Pleurodeles waltl TaxID=8319 RepID=A0AAV7MK24_PLEWA|nr:hypothetical protein NDU88_001127 [Pleurodeles waltl]